MSSPIRVDTPTLSPSPDSATSAFPTPPEQNLRSLTGFCTFHWQGSPVAMQSTHESPTTAMSSFFAVPSVTTLSIVAPCPGQRLSDSGMCTTITDGSPNTSPPSGFHSLNAPFMMMNSRPPVSSIERENVPPQM